MEQLLLHLTDTFVRFNEYAKANPVLAGVVSLWGLGVLTFLLRSVPAKIWQFIKHQSTTTLSFTSDPIGTNAQTFVNFMMWFETNQGQFRKWSRSLALNSISFMRRGEYGLEFDRDGTQAGVGQGWHMFTYRRRPMWMRRTRLEKGSIQNLVYEIEITMLGRDRQILLDLIEEFKYRPPTEQLGVYSWRNECWCRSQDIPMRPLNTVMIDKNTKESLLQNLTQWKESREWYESRGLPYKITCLLRGEPGTGKTSLIKALASHFGMNVCVINLHKMTDETFPEALTEAEPNSIIVIEDFDSTHATRARTTLVKKDEPSDKAKNLLDEVGSMAFGLTLSGILNSLDGIVSLHNKVVFLTTNAYDGIDPAVLRKGRIDHIYEIGKLQNAEIREYIQLMFPGTEVDPRIELNPILGCDLQDLYFRHRNSAQDFVAAIPKVAHAMRAV